VVTRSAHFGLETELPQDISGTGQVLGALGDTSYGGGGLIHVAVLNSGGGGNVVSQLSDDNLVRFPSHLGQRFADRRTQ